MIQTMTRGLLVAAVIGATTTLAAAQPPVNTQVLPQPDQQWKLGVTISAHKGGGLLIHQVFPDSPAAAVGLKPGMVIFEVDGMAFNDPLAAREKIVFQSGDTLDLVYSDGTGFYRVTAQLTPNVVVVAAAKPGMAPVKKVVPKAANVKRVQVADPRKKN